MEVDAREKPQREEARSSARYTSPRPFREWQPEQGQLLPQYARDVLGEGLLASFFVDLSKALDFSGILGAYTKECGQPPYHPVMMALLLMYAYARGITSSREIERRCETDIAFTGQGGGWVERSVQLLCLDPMGEVRKILSLWQSSTANDVRGMPASNSAFW